MFLKWINCAASRQLEGKRGDSLILEIKIMLNKISIQGLLRKNREFVIVGREDTTPISNVVRRFEGMKLDELQISAVLKSENDFDELIQLLQVHKHCFTNLPQDY